MTIYSRQLLAACILVLSAGCSRNQDPPAPAAFAQNEQLVDNAWEGWWPKGQWPRDGGPPKAEEVRNVNRDWKRVDYPRIDTPWGGASPSLGTLEVNPPYPPFRGLRFDLVFSGPGTGDIEKWKSHSAPAKGDIKAEIIAEGQRVRASKNGDPAIAGWSGGSLGSSGDLMVEFDWLPSDLRDYWVRVQLPQRTFWFLIPYGLGTDPSGTLEAFAQDGKAPVRPAHADPEDTVVLWSRVEYELGWLDAQGKIRNDAPKEMKEVWAWMKDKKLVSLRMSNPFDGQCILELYHESNETWSLTSPRTTVALGIPSEQVVHSKCMGVRRSDSMRREDSFDFWRHGGERRTWALLRVTIEEAVFEKAVPGSLFLMSHGGPR